MSDPNSDGNLRHHIERLVAEEHTLLNRKDRRPDDHERLENLKVELDQCWDLLRQRQARREFGQDPDEAKVRPPEVVENYEQ